MVIAGIEPEFEAPISIAAENIAQGRFLLERDGDAILIGRRLANLLGVTAGDRVNLLGRSKHETMRQRTSDLLLAVFLPARLFGHSVFCLGLHAFAKLTNSSAQSRPSVRQSTGSKDQQHDDEDDE